VDLQQCIPAHDEYPLASFSPNYRQCGPLSNVFDEPPPENLLSFTVQLSERPKSTQDLKGRPSDVVFSLKLAIYFITLIHGCLFALSVSPFLKCFGIAVLGVMFAHGVELQHQALHYNGFKSKKWNEVFGVMLGLPMLVSFAGYQDSHLQHHRLLGTKENKEFFNYGDQYGASPFVTAWAWVARLMMPMHYATFIKNVLLSIFFRKIKSSSDGVSKRMCRDYVVMVLAILVLAFVSICFRSPVIVYIWLMPLVLVAAPVHALIEMPEHYRCDMSSTDPLLNTRTITSNVFMTWLTNGNNYHVEHHMMPGLSIDRLQDLHTVIAADIPHYHRTYREFYGALLRGTLAARSLDIVDGRVAAEEEPLAPAQSA
jgi:fatty acid desaturase